MEKSRPVRYFFHPTAPEEERMLGPNLKAGTNHLVFAAETTSALKVEFGHYWAMSVYKHERTGCDDAEKDGHVVCPLVIRDKDDFVAGYVIVPAELSTKMKADDEAGRYELIRISRTKPREQTERGEEDPDLLVDEEVVTMEKTSFPDRPGVEKSKHSCACDQRRFYLSKPWCLYNVMLVEWEAQVAYRMGLGTVHIDAWAQAKPREKIITLG
ncbi:hypothetical protein MMC21_006292 [Puttea exsequens]|nr:hypothetical protein [Puttea exsequens]